MITPIRGRKHESYQDNPEWYGLKDDNPDKGTETRMINLKLSPSILLKDDNPDKGTETFLSISDLKVENFSPLKDDNPDKGTETYIRPNIEAKLLS